MCSLKIERIQVEPGLQHGMIAAKYNKDFNVAMTFILSAGVLFVEVGYVEFQGIQVVSQDLIKKLSVHMHDKFNATLQYNVSEEVRKVKSAAIALQMNMQDDCSNKGMYRSG